MSVHRVSKPIRLVHITTVSQTLNFLVPHFRALRTRGVDVHVIAAPGTDLDRFVKDEGVTGHAIPMTRRITPWRDLLALVALIRIFRDLRPDIVHAHTPKAGLLGMLAARLTGVPVRVYHLHGLPLETATGLKRAVLAWCDWLACRCAHQIYSVSFGVREVIVEERICSPERIRVLKQGSISGIDAAHKFAPQPKSGSVRNEVRTRWGIGHDDLVVGFVGRLVRDKGFRELAASWQILREEFHHAHLLIAGRFEVDDPALSLARQQLESDERVHFVGHEPNMPPLFSAMDVIAFPTYREGLPYVPLEAAAMQLPVVASRVTGCVDVVVDGVTGTLIPARDSTALADAVRSYLIDPRLRDRHGQQARQHVVTNFAPQEVLSALFDEYDLLLRSCGKVFPPTNFDLSRAA